ncbi:hypothetical protein [Leptolyngbya sp. 7M]|uniref:hypothetical protein n=1 Tax=Leptolyngbya sp. 7M TaxID=2812896 RepID=UPI001B8CE48C|nr:hypothetical protein [Leptolyngbya sp. 7M]QYO63337.1 hypothetical protein JVX88_25950 [Leptolyngbya sp. 7M]
MTNSNDQDAELRQVSQQLGELQTQISTRLDSIERQLESETERRERFDEKFSNYQQAIQWVVQLSFTLIASATITVIITAVLKK